jgi:hypothetical protein
LRFVQNRAVVQYLLVAATSGHSYWLPAELAPDTQRPLLFLMEYCVARRDGGCRSRAAGAVSSKQLGAWVKPPRRTSERDAPARPPHTRRRAQGGTAQLTRDKTHHQNCSGDGPCSKMSRLPSASPKASVHSLFKNRTSYPSSRTRSPYRSATLTKGREVGEGWASGRAPENKLEAALHADTRLLHRSS